MERIYIEENGLYLVLEVNDAQELKLLHFSVVPFEEETLTSPDGTAGFYPVEVAVSGQDRPCEIHGCKYAESAPGYRLKYREMKDYRTEYGRKLELVSADAQTGLKVCSHLQFFDGIRVARSWTTLFNEGTQDPGIEYVTSFALTGIEKEGMLDADEKLEVLIPHNAWMKEMTWSRHRMKDFGMELSQKTMMCRSSQKIVVSNTGNWSAKEHLPMGAVKNTEAGTMLFWQIEHNGSWHWEIADVRGNLYLHLSGPDELYSHWWKKLKPGESFESVPVCVGAVCGDIDEMGAELTKYRRRIRRENEDNRKLPIIFNDYMNCLYGDPTTERELPMIDKAAQAGCEYYCIDAGWYSDVNWWDSVGEWQPSKRRFPDGLKTLLDHIRSKGMIPGLWLEIEVMGIHCPKVERISEDWFFIRHGEKVAYRSRYQLDFRNPAVIAHATEVIDRLVEDYGVGYIKMDYNIEPGAGTEWMSDSFGDGLLEHNRAYLNWLDQMFARHPGLVIENCSSGGMRMDYAMLCRHSIQSTSDVEDYRMYATIAANAPLALAPEQAAVWSYPLQNADREETIFNMVNALLLRIHQSGHLVNLEGERYDLVKEALDLYKQIRGDICKALPFWPLGVSHFSDPWVSLGLRVEEKDKDFVAVWRRDSQDPRAEIPVKHRKGRQVRVTCVYPKEASCRYRWNERTGILTVELPERMSARLFRIYKLSVKEYEDPFKG